MLRRLINSITGLPGKVVAVLFPIYRLVFVDPFSLVGTLLGLFILAPLRVMYLSAKGSQNGILTLYHGKLQEENKVRDVE